MIQIVYDKIVDFCGVGDIPCVIVGSKIVGSKCDLAPSGWVTPFLAFPIQFLHQN